MRDRLVRAAAVFLAVSYTAGGPVVAFLEYTSQTLSQRFDLPPALIYLTAAVQLACAVGVLVRPLAVWGAGALTIITVGAVASHLSIGSPVTALPALFYTGIQVWFGLRIRAQDRRG